MKETYVYATGDAGRRLVQILYRKPRHSSYTIERRDHRRELIGVERGGSTLRDTKTMSRSILTSQRYRDIEFRNTLEEPAWKDVAEELPAMQMRVEVRGEYTPDGMGWPIAYRTQRDAGAAGWRWESNEWRGMSGVKQWRPIQKVNLAKLK